MNGSGRGLFAPRVPDALWAPAIAGLSLILLGLISLGLGHPLLFPSLGPTLFRVAVEPADRTQRPWNIVAGHLLAFGSAALAVWSTGAASLAPMSAAEPLQPQRAAAAVIALVLTMVVQRLVRAVHAPAAATALLVSLGVLPMQGSTALYFSLAVVLAALWSEILRRVRGGVAA
ncbi:MAG: HPP family protein [Planctomycetaceae bacterium]|nr:HPP family protein [Planctomycetaceae bacterium]